MKNSIIHKIKYGLITTLVLTICIFLDQLSKILTDQKTIEFLGNFLHFESVHNIGAAYGIFAGKTIGLIIVTTLVLIGLIVFNWFYKKKSILYCFSMGLILGGAIGNLIDRIFLGYVRDFIRMSIFSFTFNVADACLCVGVALLVIHILFFDAKILSKKKDKTNGTN